MSTDSPPNHPTNDAQGEPRTPRRPRTLPATGTPCSGSSATFSPYSSNILSRDEINQNLAKEIHGYFVGPMPPEEFLDAFLPRSSARPFREVPFPKLKAVLEGKPSHETKLYSPFMDDAKYFTSNLKIINSSGSPDIMCGLKPDICFYQNSPSFSTDLSEIIMPVEFKPSPAGDPFSDDGDGTLGCPFELWAHSVTSKKIDGPGLVRGQIASYVGAIMQTRLCTHLFIICIFGSMARIMRWDPSGVVVTKRFDLNETEFLAEFLWRFNKMSEAQRGQDASVVRVRQVEEEYLAPRAVLETLKNEAFEYVNFNKRNTSETIQRHRYFCLLTVSVPPGPEGRKFEGVSPTVPDSTQPDANEDSEPAPLPPLNDPTPAMRHFLISYPLRIAASTAVTPFGCQAHQFYAFDTQRKELVTLKQYWRMVHDDIPPEHKVYEKLHNASVPNIPTVWLASDVGGPSYVSRTQNYQFGGTTWSSFPSKAKMPLCLYRIALNVVAISLTSFTSTLHLTQSVRDAALALHQAIKDAKILHRNIGVGSIMLDRQTLRGVLMDWDLSSDLSSSKGARQPDREISWQFRSVELLDDPHIRHREIDDIESFLWTILWVALLYSPHNLDEDELRRELATLDARFSHVCSNGETKYSVRHEKRGWLFGPWDRRIVFESSQNLRNLIGRMKRTMSERYGYDREKAGRDIHTEWLIKTLDAAIDEDGWVKDDAAVRNTVNPTDLGRDNIDPAKRKRVDDVLDGKTNTSSKALKGGDNASAGQVTRAADADAEENEVQPRLE